MSQERNDDTRRAYLVVGHENGHAASIEWDRKKRAFVCEEMDVVDDGDEYITDDVDTIIAKLDAQAHK